MCPPAADPYQVTDLVKTYGMSPQEAQRLLAQFGSDREGLDLLLANGSRVASERDAEPKLDGDFLFSI